jgi:hypothetical protein
MSSTVEVVHHGFRCNACNANPIKGMRFSKRTNEAKNLCEKDFDKLSPAERSKYTCHVESIQQHQGRTLTRGGAKQPPQNNPQFRALAKKHGRDLNAFPLQRQILESLYHHNRKRWSALATLLVTDASRVFKELDKWQKSQQQKSLTNGHAAVHTGRHQPPPDSEVAFGLEMARVEWDLYKQASGWHAPIVTNCREENNVLATDAGEGELASPQRNLLPSFAPHEGESPRSQKAPLSVLEANMRRVSSHSDSPPQAVLDEGRSPRNQKAPLHVLEAQRRDSPAPSVPPKVETRRNQKAPLHVLEAQQRALHPPSAPHEVDICRNQKVPLHVLEADRKRRLSSQKEEAPLGSSQKRNCGDLNGKEEAPTTDLSKGKDEADAIDVSEDEIDAIDPPEDFGSSNLERQRKYISDFRKSELKRRRIDKDAKFAREVSLQGGGQLNCIDALLSLIGGSPQHGNIDTCHTMGLYEENLMKPICEQEGMCQHCHADLFPLELLTKQDPQRSRQCAHCADFAAIIQFMSIFKVF